MSEATLEGGCLCGALRFRVSGEARHRAYCHCRSCRLATGAPFVAWATFPAERFELLRGELKHVRSSEKVERGFCASCGTSISYVHDARPRQIDVSSATLDDATAIRPECHIWVSDKLPWVEIGDGLPQFAEWKTKASG